MKSQLWWYVARSGGVVAWALATASVVWGLVLSSRVLGKRVSIPKLLDLHRFLGGSSVVFVGIHLSGLLLDSKVDFGPSALFVPMASTWEPGAVAWGVVAFYLLLAVEITSLLRSRIGERAWRTVHYGGFGVFLLGTIHGLRAGTDVENPVIWWPAAIAGAGIVGLCAYRIFAGDPVRVVPRSERIPAALLERTLSQLERLDTEAYPVGAPGASALPGPTSPPSEPEPAPPLLAEPAPAPAPTPAQHGAILAVPHAALGESSMFPDMPPAPPHGESPAPPGPGVPEITAPAPSRADTDERVLGASLPVRTPRRVAATTAPATSLSGWRPAVAGETRDAGPPPPPDAIDPRTGEPDPHAYRRWLREWLAYVESQP
jgi:DMSO/TMAO reductase YedYZ heme-binding membrane subunit